MHGSSLLLFIVQLSLLVASSHTCCGCMQVAGLRYLVPQEGSVVTSCLVVMDDDHETGLPYPAALDRVKQQMLERLDQVFILQLLSTTLAVAQCFL